MNLANTNVKLDANGYLLVAIGSGSSVLFGDGTAAAPSIAFSSQAGLGFYRSAASVLDLMLPAYSTSSSFVQFRATTGFVLGNGLALDFTLSGGAGGTILGAIQMVTTQAWLFGNAAGTAGARLGTLTDGTLSIRGAAGTAGTGNVDVGAKISIYNQVTLAGQGVVTIPGYTQVVAATTAATVMSYTNGATDATVVISANMLITTHGSEAITFNCTYTDPVGTTRSAVLNFGSLAGAIAPTCGAAAPFHGIPITIRCKATTTVAVATTGTFTGGTYTADAAARVVNS